MPAKIFGDAIASISASCDFLFRPFCLRLKPPLNRRSAPRYCRPRRMIATLVIRALSFSLASLRPNVTNGATVPD
jgi:hypothetical protein